PFSRFFQERGVLLTWGKSSFLVRRLASHKMSMAPGYATGRGQCAESRIKQTKTASGSKKLGVPANSRTNHEIAKGEVAKPRDRPVENFNRDQHGENRRGRSKGPRSEPCSMESPRIIASGLSPYTSYESQEDKHATCPAGYGVTWRARASGRGRRFALRRRRVRRRAIDRIQRLKHPRRADAGERIENRLRFATRRNEPVRSQSGEMLRHGRHAEADGFSAVTVRSPFRSSQKIIRRGRLAIAFRSRSASLASSCRVSKFMLAYLASSHICVKPRV